MVGYVQGNNDHIDLQQSPIAQDEEEVKAIIMVDLIESNWTNPFSSYQPLLSISTGATASPEIDRDLSRAYLVGETTYQQFRKERLEPEKPPVKFHHTLSKQKLMTFSDHNKTRKAKQSKGNATVLRGDRNLFARKIIIAESRQLQMQEVLCHPLGPLPASLATSNGLPRKTNKAQLGRKFSRETGSVNSGCSIPTPSAYLIDGMSLIQKLQVDHHTFGKIAEMALSRVLREGEGSSRIDVVFDVYRDVSIKSVERES